MKENGVIDKLGFSFHFSKDESRESYIRFGRVPSHKADKDLVYVRTIGKSWKLHAQSIFIGRPYVVDSETIRTFLIEPSSPYIHMPLQDFKSFMKKIENQISYI